MQQVHRCLVLVATELASGASHKPGFAEFVISPARQRHGMLKNPSFFSIPVAESLLENRSVNISDAKEMLPSCGCPSEPSLRSYVAKLCLHARVRHVEKINRMTVMPMYPEVPIHSSRRLADRKKQKSDRPKGLLGGFPNSSALMARGMGRKNIRPDQSTGSKDTRGLTTVVDVAKVQHRLPTFGELVPHPTHKRQPPHKLIEMWIKITGASVVVQLEGERVAGSGGIAAENLRDASLQLVHQITTRLSAFNPI